MMDDKEIERNNYKPEISTLVFMDLESTGLPSDVGKKNVNITEMSLVAVDRSSFEEDNNLRILNKISLCVRPRSIISPFSMNITGLYNDILESQEEFDDSVPKLLEYFFRRLQKPICLLAHNGYKFDFPLLQAELNRLNYTLGPDLVCADTLVAFRSICKLKKDIEELKLQHKKYLPTHSKSCENIPISDEDIDNLLSEDLDSFSCIDDFIPSKDVKSTGSEILPSENKLPVEEKTRHEECDFLPSILNEQTPEKQKIAYDGSENIQIKRKKKRILDPTYTPQLEYKKRMKPTKRNIPAKRTLFTEYDPSSFNIHKITSFSLQNLYNHFFNESPPNSHYAEVDTVCLSKVCQKIHKDFLQWIDENSVSFSTINALW